MKLFSHFTDVTPSSDPASAYLDGKANAPELAQVITNRAGADLV